MMKYVLMTQELTFTTIIKYISLNFVIVNKLLQVVISITHSILNDKFKTTTSLKGE